MRGLPIAALCLSAALLGCGLLASINAQLAPAAAAPQRAAPALLGTAGVYLRDPAHASVIARVAHGGGIS